MTFPSRLSEATNCPLVYVGMPKKGTRRVFGKEGAVMSIVIVDAVWRRRPINAGDTLWTPKNWKLKIVFTSKYVTTSYIRINIEFKYGHT